MVSTFQTTHVSSMVSAFCTLSAACVARLRWTRSVSALNVVLCFRAPCPRSVRALCGCAACGFAPCRLAIPALGACRTAACTFARCRLACTKFERIQVCPSPDYRQKRLATYGECQWVCVLTLLNWKQKKPILFKVTEPRPSSCHDPGPSITVTGGPVRGGPSYDALSAPAG